VARPEAEIRAPIEERIAAMRANDAARAIVAAVQLPFSFRRAML
jgi:hypothetical protein